MIITSGEKIIVNHGVILHRGNHPLVIQSDYGFNITIEIVYGEGDAKVDYNLENGHVFLNYQNVGHPSGQGTLDPFVLTTAENSFDIDIFIRCLDLKGPIEIIYTIRRF